MSESLEGRRVLVIEDSPVVAPFTVDVLAELGCEVIGPAPNMASAREMVEAAVFPLCELLAAKRIPFVLTSGYADWTMPEKWQDRPRLQKPYTVAQVEEAMSGLFDE
jgi:CheY-like chemotaxis protein